MRHLAFIITFMILSVSCSQLTPFHSARTEGQQNMTISAAIDGTSAASSGNTSGDAPALPGLRAELAYGMSENFDLIASVYTAGSIKASLKYQVIGDNNSIFALALMPGYEYQNSFFITGNAVQVQRLHFPAIFSVRGNDIFDYYVGPDLVLQFDNDPQNTALPGVFGGFEIGKRIKYNIGLGAYIPYVFNIGTRGYLIQFGASARIPLFRNN